MRRRVRRVEWSDLNADTQEQAIRATMRRGSVTREEAEEVVASAVARLMQRRPLVRDAGALLAAASFNLLRNERRQHASRPAHFPLVQEVGEDGDSLVNEDPTDTRPDPASELMEREERAWQGTKLRAALGQLSPTDRVILSAFYFEGRSLKSIDKDRDDLPGTAKVRLFRARQRLARLFEEIDEERGRSR